MGAGENVFVFRASGAPYCCWTPILSLSALIRLLWTSVPLFAGIASARPE